MKTLNTIVLHLLLILALVGCGRNREFTVAMTIDNVQAPALKLTWWGDSGMVSTDIRPAADGIFRFKGSTHKPTLVTVAGDGGVVLAQLVVAGGEQLKVRGDMKSPLAVTIEGDEHNAEWARWRAEHASLPRPGAELDAAARDYVLAHRDSPVATWILLFDHSDITHDEQAMALLDSINPEARPHSLVMTAQTIAATHAERASSLSELYLVDNDAQGYRSITLRGAETMILFWTTTDTSYRRQFAHLKELKQAHPAWRIIDVNVSSDSVRWQRVLRDEEPGDWQHLWAPCGPAEPALVPLRLNFVPQLVHLDSTAVVLQRP